MRVEDVLLLTGLSKDTLQSLIRRGEFPSPVRIGPRSARWLASSVRNWRAPEPPRTGAVSLYFFFNRTTGLMKIGVSNDPTDRRHNLENACGSILEEVGILAGGADLERPLHELFADQRVKGEWFNPTELIWDLAQSPTREAIVAAVAKPTWRTTLRDAFKSDRRSRRSSVMRRLFPESGSPPPVHFLSTGEKQ
jgi:predicted DNA-binding transcriptional regulator AlpA